MALLKFELTDDHLKLLKKQVLYSSVKFLQEVINKINENKTIEASGITGETMIDIYVLFG